MSNLQFDLDSKLSTTSNSALSAGANAAGHLLGAFNLPSTGPTSGQYALVANLDANGAIVNWAYTGTSFTA